MYDFESNASLVVGVLKLRLILPENHSLKGKRGVLKRIQAKIANQFNVSVAECGDQDLWQSALLGFGVVGSSQPIINATLQKVAQVVEEMGVAQVAEARIETFHC